MSDEPIGMVAVPAEGVVFMMDVPGTNFIVAPFLSVFRSTCACTAMVVHSVKTVRKYLFIPVIFLYRCKYMESI